MGRIIYHTQYSLDKKGIGVGHPDRGFVTHFKVNSVISVYSVISVQDGLYFLFHRFDAIDDIRTQKIAPAQYSIFELYLSEIP